jgi:hypothetical protein
VDEPEEDNYLELNTLATASVATDLDATQLYLREIEFSP